MLFPSYNSKFRTLQKNKNKNNGKRKPHLNVQRTPKKHGARRGVIKLKANASSTYLNPFPNGFKSIRINGKNTNNTRACSIAYTFGPCKNIELFDRIIN